MNEAVGALVHSEMQVNCALGRGCVHLLSCRSIVPAIPIYVVNE